MKKLTVLLVVVPLVVGCSLFRPAVDNPDLVREYEAAQDAVEEAEYHKAAEYASDTFETAQDRLTDVRDRHLESPTRELIKDYNEVQVLAGRAAIDALSGRLEQKENKLETLADTIGRKNKSLEQLNSRLQDKRSQVKELAGKNQKLKSRKRELTETNRSLTRDKERLQQETSQMRQRLKKQRRVVERLEQRVDKVETRAREMQARLEKKSERLRELKQENKSIVQEFESRLEKAKVRKEKRGVVVNLGQKILFEIGDTRLLEEGKKTLKKLSDILQDYPEREIRVEGHTCDLPVREAYPSNWELSAHRALRVLKYLAYAQEIDKSRIAAVAHGQFSPLVPNTSSENREKNRRVEITLLPPDLPDKVKEVN